MRRALLSAFAAACGLALSAVAAPDDSAVANRKWVREYVGANAVKARASIAGIGGSATFSSALPGTNDMSVSVTVCVPTNQALFVAWSTEPRIPAYGYYAKVPGMPFYANVSNAFLSTISFSVTNWVEYGTNELGQVRTCSHSSTRWTATASNGEKWSTAYLNGNTILCCSTNTARYVVIQRTTVADGMARTLRGPWGVAWNAPAAPPSLLSALIGQAFADEHHVEVERGGGTLGYHEAVYVESFTVTDLLGKHTYRIAYDGKDHQYDPYGGKDHADLAAGEAYYRTPEAMADPGNWGYSSKIIVDVLDKDGNPTGVQMIIFKSDLMASKAWLDAVNVELPKPNEPDEPKISDPSEHDCGVFDAEGNHIGCVCTYRFCKYCPSCDSKYTITKTWSDGSVEKSEEELAFVGARHNAKSVAFTADGYCEQDDGCLICWSQDNASDGTHFCGNMDAYNVGGAAKSHHMANDIGVTGREACGCMCGKYGDGDDALIPANMHVHPYSYSDGHGPHNGQNSYCWCFCRRHHNGVFYGENAEGACPNQCAICGAYRTCDGVKINGLHADPLPYRVTDDGGLPDIDDHEPSASRCGCKCGAISPGNEQTYPLMKEREDFHVIDDGTCTCTCRRRMHKVHNETGHCTKICTLCGKKNGQADDGDGGTVITAVTPTWEDHTPYKGHCGCECNAFQDGFVGNEGGRCGYRGVETGPSGDPAWHSRKKAEGVEYCCCACGVYSDHMAKDGKHAEWFIEGEACRAVCKGVNAFGQRCGKLSFLNRKALWSEHTPLAGGCGCECHGQDAEYGYAGNEAGIRDAVEYHTREGETCHCFCQGNWTRHAQWMTAKGSATEKCLFVCTCGRYADGTRMAALDDHTERADGCGCLCGDVSSTVPILKFHHGVGGPYGCRCACGALHLWCDANTANNKCGVCSMCGLTAGDADGDKEELHKLNDEIRDDCRCWCGHYGRGRHATSDKSLHHGKDETDKHGVYSCECACGNSAIHLFRGGGACPGVCAFCKERLESGIKASEEDHAAFGEDDAPTRCGCRCGKVGAGDTDANRFHYRWPEHCICLGSDGNGGKHHFVDAHPDCPGICKWPHPTLGRHKVASHDHERSIEKDTGAAHCLDWHTGRTDGLGCGCRCRVYHGGNVGEWGRFRQDWHNNNPNVCGCWCLSDFGMNQKDWHVYGDGCRCLCPIKWHRPVVTEECPDICKACFGLVSAAKGPTEEAGRLSHEGAGEHGHCGCRCGKFPGASYEGEYLAFHHVIAQDCWDVCDDDCGKVRNHTRFDPNECGRCISCGYDRDGKEKNHEYNADSCVCRCGEVEREHAMKRVGEATTSSEHCDICGADIEHKDFTWQCERCGFTEVSTATVGKHGPHEGQGQPENPYFCDFCSCNCTAGKGGEPCDACINKVGTCANCGRSCGLLTGGDTGGGLHGEGENDVDPWHID